MQWREERSRDWNALVRAALLLALAAFVVRLVWTGELKGYVNPKFTTFTASATVGLVLMAWGQIARGLKRSHGPSAPLRMRLYLTMAAILGLGFTLKPVVFSADLAAKQGLNMSRRSGAAPAAAVAAEPVAEPGAGSGAEPASGPVAGPGSEPVAEPVTAPVAAPMPSEKPVTPVPAPTTTAPAPSPPSPPKPLQITAGNFVKTMNEIYLRPEQFAGKRVALDGFTFHPPESEGELFAVIRLVVTCHVAHAAPDGLLAIMPGKPRPGQDQWVRAEGVLEPATFNGASTVRLRIEKLTPIDKPEDPYVYP